MLARQLPFRSRTWSWPNEVVRLFLYLIGIMSLQISSNPNLSKSRFALASEISSPSQFHINLQFCVTLR